MQCVFRRDVQTTDGQETARCLLLEQLSSSTPGTIRVPRGACEVCLRHCQDLLAGHPVFPSLLLGACETAMAEAGTLSGGRQAELDRRRQELTDLVTHQTRRSLISGMPTCDVILRSTSDRAEFASVLEQQDSAVFVWPLLAPDDSESAFGDARPWNVRPQRVSPNLSMPGFAHGHIRSFQSGWILMSESPQIWPASAVSDCLRDMELAGGEVLVVEPAAGGLPQAVFIRRPTFVDMGGSDGLSESIAALAGRAICSQRAVRRRQGAAENSSSQPLTEVPREWRLGQAGEQRGMGFPALPVACDVVIPFHGHPDYVDAAMQSLVEQRDCPCVLHLADDATPADTTGLLRKWQRHPQVRVYRNKENLGQFQTFNNVSHFFETELAAVQDADDISLPDRLQQTALLMEYSGTDLAGASVETFGDGPTRQRHSVWPRRGRDHYFLENPTLMVRVPVFRSVGGFADFGDRLQNRASVDTEFQQRCLWHGVRIAVSRRIVLRYRVHAASATQDDQTGWGTTAREAAGRQLDARVALYERGGFDPQAFGSLSQGRPVTERL